MDKFGSQGRYIRFKTPEQLQSYLESAGNTEFSFRTHPISGKSETFHCKGGTSIIRETDRRSFNSLDDFTCYTFQCDAEGYSNTEYVDIEVLD